MDGWSLIRNFRRIDCCVNYEENILQSEWITAWRKSIQHIYRKTIRISYFHCFIVEILDVKSITSFVLAYILASFIFNRDGWEFV